MYKNILKYYYDFTDERKRDFMKILFPDLFNRGYQSISSELDYTIEEITKRVHDYNPKILYNSITLDDLINDVKKYKLEADPLQDFKGKTKEEEFSFISEIELYFSAVVDYLDEMEFIKSSDLLKQTDHITKFIDTYKLVANQNDGSFSLVREFTAVIYMELLLIAFNLLTQILLKETMKTRNALASSKTKDLRRALVKVEQDSLIELLMKEEFIGIVFKVFKMYPYLEGKVDMLYKEILLVSVCSEAKKEARSTVLFETVRKLYKEFNKLEEVGLSYYNPSSILYFSDLDIISLESVEQFLMRLEKVKNNVFRGHSDINYRMVPSVFRGVNPMVEHKFIDETVRVKPNEFINLNTNFKVLSKLQHYGTPTRLLDFTTNPLVALYFACIGDKESQRKTGEVISLSYSDHNYTTLNSDKVKLLSALARLKYSEKAIYDFLISVYPSDMVFSQISKKLIHEVKHENPGFKNEIVCKDLKRNYFIKGSHDTPRIIAQSGCFGIAGLTMYYDKEINLLCNKGDGRGTKSLYIIEGERNKNNILNQLKTIDINDAKMFPELEKVAVYIRDNIHDL